MDYVTIDDLLEVARRVVGGEEQVRDAGLVASAAARPRTTIFGQDAYPAIWEKAAALMESLGRNHALIDGNKRLAWNAVWLFLGLNSHLLREPLDEDIAEQFVVDVVTGKLEVPQIAAGLLSFAE
ncbi:death-on-curing protein [Streptacidiphilus sp. PB12-B1b]|uniref:type II toxin-antitoxin system death-on-curing family toxin n=1 Tax=Streptacidiphilus sp. PB12-B1b TaxID=2705012 RepID=UPI0015FB6A9F|nr:Fic family protein [Streptacidiphilus sp. PB12-B1b]QMU80018.1 death-on-curing protein [Streptacidiphilus sp. PB12-B1b]